MKKHIALVSVIIISASLLSACSIPGSNTGNDNTGTSGSGSIGQRDQSFRRGGSFGSGRINTATGELRTLMDAMMQARKDGDTQKVDTLRKEMEAKFPEFAWSGSRRGGGWPRNGSGTRIKEVVPQEGMPK